ncbi:MAG TPA: M20 family metallopeptidase [Candidatus Limnocylindrales bacterium]|nr:M20 family metallopeptidase [Candidatus Limnocylindrales bacterium]
MTTTTERDLIEAALEIQPNTIAIRRRIHRHPEQGLHLPETQQTIVDELLRIGLRPRKGKDLSSVTAWIGEGRPGRAIVLRADMDALPLNEDTGLEFSSEIAGTMHACGHDTHVAMLLGAARLLRDKVDELPGPVLLMFQPGEEGYAGARVMLEEGLLEGLDPKTTRAFAIHIDAEYPSGTVRLRSGTQMASADNVFITVHGRGGHASQPHLALDPIPVAAEIVLALQAAVTRQIDIFDPAVVTIAHITAGTTHNIIPPVAKLEGTFRTVSKVRRDDMPRLIRQVAEGVAAAHGTTADVEFRPVYPVTVSDPRVFDLVREIALGLVGDDDVVTMKDPLMGAEDWSFVLQQVPGIMAFLGARPRGTPLEGFAMNHSNIVVFDEEALPVGVALYAKVALELI